MAFGRRPPTKGRRGTEWRFLRQAGTAILAATVGVSPLLVGSVHRPTELAVLAGLSLAFLCTFFGERLRGRFLRAQSSSILFLLLVLIPLVQLVPLPSALRGKIDPGGAALLENAPNGTPRTWPLSLDPSSTETEIGVAAGALVAFILTVHDATKRRSRKPVLEAIALAGLLGVSSGLLHRIVGFDRLYGLFDVYGAVFPGPFINPNHSAEFYELAAFSALALAMGAGNESRIAWFAAAGVNAAAALTTLSRGSLLALFAGGATFFVLRLRVDRSDGVDANPGTGRMGKTIAWSLFAVVCLVCMAIALGASPVFDEVAHTHLGDSSEKIVVWKDSLPLVLRHPLGIGRHAFDRVYPAYKTLTVNSRFEFVENGPLQLLIDVGWPGVVLLGGALVWLVFKLNRTWRGDYVEAALFAGLVAIGAHNLVDFGMETMGIRLPFAAMAGVMVGRALGRTEGGSERNTTTPFMAISVSATVAIGLAVGLRAAFGVSAANLEEGWRRSTPGEQRREIALDGGRRFPTDYYFPLLESYDEPLRPIHGSGTSPRLAALNRALRLCPACSVVHQQVGRALLALGLRAQALSSFRDSVRLIPSQTGVALVELDAQHFSPAELATLAVGDATQILEVARYLVPKGAQAEREVGVLIADAGKRGGAVAEGLLVKADLALGLGHHADARAALLEGRRLAPQDGRFDLELSLVAEHEGQLEEALADARAATTLSPFSVTFARRRLALVLRLQRWVELDEALSLLKVALRQSGQNVTEVHMLAGDTLVARGNLARALSEYRTAATLDASNPATWAAVGRVSEARGDLNGALSAYRQQAAVRPTDVEAQQAIARVDKARVEARIRQMLP